MTIDRKCSVGSCQSEAVGWVGKFGETRTSGSLVTTPPGHPISVNYCVEHEDELRLYLREALINEALIQPGVPPALPGRQ